jgi:hypothetical protein
MNSRAQDRTRSGTVVDPRASLALWLRAGRAQRKLSLDDVARITKIQPRILEKLESGQLDGLPAEVFVRGFVRSFARCVGLDEGEALVKLGACGPATTIAAPPVARALVETMSELAPKAASEMGAVAPASEPIEAQIPEIEIEIAPVVVEAATPAIEAAPAVETAVAVEPAPKAKKRSRKKSETKTDGTKPTRSRKKRTTAQPVVEISAAPVEAPAAPSSETQIEAVIATTLTPAVALELMTDSSVPLLVEDVTFAVGSEPIVTPIADAGESTQSWQPTMPPLASTPSVPWRRPAFTATSTAYVAPTLVIDDADPELADREREERLAAAKNPQRVSFLPPILLDREDRSGRQGGLTLAVIILLIAATLTLSYLMRRPSVSGDGVTMLDTPSLLA